MGSRLIAIFILLFLSPVVASCSLRDRPSVVLQEIDITLLPDSHEVSGVSRVVMRPGGASRASFTMTQDATVVSTSINGKETPFTFIGSVLSMDLPRNDRELTVEISYRCAFDDHPPAEVVSGEDPTYGVNAIVSKRGVFLGPAAGWYPAPTIIPSRRIIRVSAPLGTEAITVGRPTFRGSSEGRSRSVWEESNPAGDLSLSAGPYRIEERVVDGLPLYTYFTRENAGLSGRYLDAAARYIRFYKGMFGPYPFEKFAIVENFFPTGYGFPSYTLLGSAVIRLPFIPETSLPHEIVHSWWGNGVLADFADGNWSEGLVTYLADYLLQERKSSMAGREYRSMVLSEYASLVTPDRDLPLAEFTARVDPASRSIGYGKGMMVFHMLRRMVGDDIFFKGLREICRQRLFKRTTWNDFITSYARLSGRDLTIFGKEWVERGGGPHLNLGGVKWKREKRGWSVKGYVEQKGDLYHLPLPLELETADGATRQRVDISGRQTPFIFTVSSPPRRLALDPDRDLFRVLYPEEIPPTVNRIKGARSLLVVVGDGCLLGSEGVELLLKSLAQEGAKIVPERKATGKTIAGHDLLFCGYPGKWRIGPSLPVDFFGNGFSVRGERFDKPEDALFMVSGHPTDSRGVAALFQANSREAADQSLLKITHYGKYSYLAFTAGKNMAKGFAPGSSKVSAVEFPTDR